MPVFEDPLRALRMELPPGFAFDPFSSSLTDLYFAKWNSTREAINVYIEPARCPPDQPDQVWLERIDRETEQRSDLVDLWSPSGRAVAVAFYPPGGVVERVSFIRGPRVDIGIGRYGGDPTSGDPWAPLPQAARSAISAANTNPGTISDSKDVMRLMQIADEAVKRGDGEAARKGFQLAVWMASASWLHTLWGPLNDNHVLWALQLSRILARVGTVSQRPAMLRDAEYIAQRVQRTLRTMGDAALKRYGTALQESLDDIYLHLRRQVDPQSGAPYSRIDALATRATWLANAALEAFRKEDLEECQSLCASALDDLLAAGTQRQRGLDQTPPDPLASDRKGELHWAVQTVKTLQVQFGCARALQDASTAVESAELIAAVTARLNELGEGKEGIRSMLEATALLAQAGTFLFLGDDAVEKAQLQLEQVGRLLDAAKDEGELRATLCLNLGWNRYYAKQYDGLLELTDRGLAAARKDGPPNLRRSLHALRAQVLVAIGRAKEAIGEADDAIEGADRPLSTHYLARAAAKSGSGDAAGALADVRLALHSSLADYPLGQDVPLVLFAASTLTEPVDVPASLELTLAAQTVLDARRLALRQSDERIAFDDAARHREVAQVLVSRLIDAGQMAAALEAADRSRARSFNQILGRPWADPAARPDRGPIDFPFSPDVVADLRAAGHAVRLRADEALAATGLQPALTFPEIHALINETGGATLLLQPVGERIHLLLLRAANDLALVVAESPASLAEVTAALDLLQGELGIFALARARGEAAPPLADIDTGGEALEDAITTLSRALIEPIASFLDMPEGGNFVVAPYRDLALVPFPLLRLPDGTPLVDRFALSVTPSLATLSLVRKTMAATEPRCFIAGDPELRDTAGLQDLPAAALEAQDVRDQLVQAGIADARVSLRLREQASEAEYRNLARGCGLVHLACHAAVREPVAESALFLASGPHDDGRLLPDEIAGVRMPGALIFLSACQTGLGRPTSDGVLGLSRAFIEAGARCVVMSMWKVADEAAARLAHHFYAELLRKQGIATAAQALRAAMRATRKDLASGSVVTSRHEVLDDHPAHWAPFLLLGDGTMTWNE